MEIYELIRYTQENALAFGIIVVACVALLLLWIYTIEERNG